jgi:hypothetical protein
VSTPPRRSLQDELLSDLRAAAPAPPRTPAARSAAGAAVPTAVPTTVPTAVVAVRPAAAAPLLPLPELTVRVRLLRWVRPRLSRGGGDLLHLELGPLELRLTRTA